MRESKLELNEMVNVAEGGFENPDKVDDRKKR
jgi:hypothetical protein